MIAALLLVIQTAYKLAKAHPDLVEALLGKAAALALAGPKHDDAAAQAGMAQGLAALAASTATTAAEREKRKAAQAKADAVAAHTLPLDEAFPDVSTLLPSPDAFGRPEDVAALVSAINRLVGAEVVAIAVPSGTIVPDSLTAQKGETTS